jgi:uncharacterized membrane protein YkvA (DUF1232 family)
MIITICLLILLYTTKGRNVEPLLNKVRDAELMKRLNRMSKKIKKYALRTGRIASRPVLQLYYVVTDENTSTADKALIYGCLVYVVMPHSLIPARVYKLLGLTDEAVAIVTVLKKVNSKITDEINAKVDATLDKWFQEDGAKAPSDKNESTAVNIKDDEDSYHSPQGGK